MRIRGRPLYTWAYRVRPGGAGYRRGAIDRQVLATESVYERAPRGSPFAMLDVPRELVRYLARLLAT